MAELQQPFDARAVTLGQVYDVATRGRLDDLNATLRRFPAAQRLKEPLAIGLRGVRAILTGDVSGGVVLLKKAADRAEGDSRSYLLELLVPFLISVGDLEGAESALRSVGGDVVELVPAFLALRAVIAARRGRDDVSRALSERALEAVATIDNAMIVARVLQRVALAALYRHEFEQAQLRAMEAARAYEALGSFRSAGTAYSVLYVIAHDWTGDPEITRFYAERMTLSGERSGDLSMQNAGLVAQLGIAAESGDHRRLGSIRARILANSLTEQYRERFAFILAEVLLHGWSGRFDAAAALLTAFSEAGGRSLPEISLCEALLALFDAARWDVVQAKRRAHLVLSQTAYRNNLEPLYDSHTRRVARIVAACTCILAGETARGSRALTTAFDPDAAFASLVTNKTLDESAVPPMVRGYARLINVACLAAKQNAPRLGLTRAEMLVLRALPNGATLSQIAADFGKSRKTIARQVGAIYEKLEVSNRAQAVQRARDLGIYA